MEQKVLIELRNLGLSEKESQVYLAALKIGSAPMQKISNVSGVNRATTYVLVGSLMRRGLMTSVSRGKKRLFTAEDPSKLLVFLEKEKLSLDTKQKAVSEVLPILQSIFDATHHGDEKPRVKFYEGKQGLTAVRDEFLKAKKKEIFSIYSIERIDDIFSVEERKKFTEKRIQKRIKSHAIYSSKTGAVEVKSPFTELTSLDMKNYSANVDVSVFDNKVVLTSLDEPIMSVIIENEAMAESISQILSMVEKFADLEKKK
jgi:sugar-specific transcriptional regulator TrmB